MPTTSPNTDEPPAPDLLDQQIAEVEAACAQLRGDIATAENELKQLNTTKAQLLAMCATLEHRCAETSAEGTRLGTALQGIRARIGEVNRRIQEILSPRSNRHLIAERIEDVRDVWEDEAVRERMVDCEKPITAFLHDDGADPRVTRLGDLNALRTNLTSELEGLGDKRSEASKAVESAKGDIVRLESRLATTEAENQALRDNIKEAHSELAEREARLQELLQVRDLGNETQTVQAKVTTLERELRRLGVNQDVLIEQVAAWNREIRSLDPEAPVRTPPNMLHFAAEIAVSANTGDRVQAAKQALRDCCANLRTIERQVEEMSQHQHGLRKAVLEAEAHFYRLVSRSLEQEGVEWQPACFVGLSGTNDWELGRLRETVADLEKQRDLVAGEVEAAQAAVDEAVHRLRTLFGHDEMEARMVYTDQMVMLVDEYGRTKRPMTEFELCETERFKIKKLRLTVNRKSARKAQLEVEHSRLEEKLAMYKAMGDDLAGLYEQACSFIKSNNSEPTKLQNKHVYKDYERVDGWEYTSACCRMLGAVNGRSDFDLGSALRWDPATGKLSH